MDARISHERMLVFILYACSLLTADHTHFIFCRRGDDLAMEQPSSYDALRGDGASPRLKLAPALMHIENMSLQSLARSTRGVGVTDLRDALEGRS